MIILEATRELISDERFPDGARWSPLRPVQKGWKGVEWGVKEAEGLHGVVVMEEK